MDPTPLIDAAAPVRWVGFLALLPLVGVLVFVLLARRRLGADAPELTADLVERARVAGVLAALVLLSSLALKLYFQVRAFSMPGEPLTWADAQPILTTTSWGHGFEWQGAAALVALIGLMIAGWTRAGWALALAGVLGLLASFPLTGHAVEHPLGPLVGVGLQGLHLAGASLWLGTLALVMGTAMPVLRRFPEGEALLARLVEGYSPLALTGAGTAAGAGVLISLTTVASWPALLDTTYGRTLLVKLVVLSGVIALGFYNWRRVRPALGAEPGAQRLTRSASAELAIGTLVLAVTAVLVALPAPGLNH
ncbi:MAG TPA: CopD family protein [Gemmatimonadales bacterium]|jgi:putative copper export protein|nr:CopD family protein [Gemmatimonadales bacterium]